MNTRALLSHDADVNFGLHFAADNMGLDLLLFTQSSLKVKLSESKTADTKAKFDMK